MNEKLSLIFKRSSFLGQLHWQIFKLAPDDCCQTSGDTESDGGAVPDVLAGLCHANDAVGGLHQLLIADVNDDYVDVRPVNVYYC